MTHGDWAFIVQEIGLLCFTTSLLVDMVSGGHGASHLYLNLSFTWDPTSSESWPIYS